MRTFIIRSRNGTTRWDKVRGQIGGRGHLEVVAHSVINAFFISQNFRQDVEVYIVLDSSEDFPRTIKLSSNQGLSIDGFYEEAVLVLIEKALKNSIGLKKDETKILDPGVEISGFGFEKLVKTLLESRSVYLLEPKGENVSTAQIPENPVFILSDHLALPKNSVKSIKRQGVKLISLGKKMLFASQCIVILHYELDRCK